jgi:hypothetical protein
MRTSETLLMSFRTVPLAAILLASPVMAFGQCTGHASVNDYDRREFLSAAYGKRSEIAVQLLAADGCTQPMLDALQRAGGVVRFADRKVGYALVLIPKNKVLDILGIPGAAYASASSQYYPIYFSDPQLAGPPPSKTAPVPPIAIPFHG